MSKIAVIYWTSTGNTKAMAEAIAKGAEDSGAKVTLSEVTEISAGKAAQYDKLALGCSAMGNEVLDDMDFLPFYEALEPMLAGKKTALFGSYGWGDGEWMRDWQEKVKKANADIFKSEGLIICETPDDEGLERCRKFGSAFAVY